MRAVTYTVSHDVKAIADTVQSILDYVILVRSISDDMIFEIKVVLNELIVNAVCHGNRCEQNKTAYVTFKAINNYLYISVKDEGEGFNHKGGTSIGKSADADCTGNSFCEHGRGLCIVQQLCSRVKFNARGNRVSIMKNLY